MIICDYIIINNNRTHFILNGFIILTRGLSMEKQYTVPEFLRLNVIQKDRLRQKDPEQYEKLRKEADKQFSPETDVEAARALAGKG